VLNVDVFAVLRTVELSTETGYIQKQKYPPNVENIKVTEFTKIFIACLVIERPGMKSNNSCWSTQELMCNSPLFAKL